ncbi:serine hydrolase FSH [Astrocystis sublimbata]|nr:serine hydrolase FSH [Astrocystis sublimbata]KAI0188561.1 serine hydrolase FSH [Astrocystis sublimbata]KAI0188566.1 serine hydrolase FSH [Astrocystis sublimbata]KAI0188567.1 serine hydrolase FSH [Astrocystis sublimbata]
MGHKVLCLHGLGTNGDIMEAQIAPLRYYLGPFQNWDFEFVDGEYAWPIDQSVAAVFGVHHTGLSYYDGTPPSALSAIDSLAAHLCQNGPYDCVIGFSLGAAMIATLLLTPQIDAKDNPEWAAARSKVRSVVFLSGTLPVDRQQLMKGHMGWIKPDEVGQNGVWNLMDIPSVHAWSPRDASNAGESQCLREMCVAHTRTEIVHDAGHAVPAHGSAVASLGLSIGTMLAQIDS